jgi:hypothetical protein
MIGVQGAIGFIHQRVVAKLRAALQRQRRREKHGLRCNDSERGHVIYSREGCLNAALKYDTDTALVFSGIPKSKKARKAVSLAG